MLLQLQINNFALIEKQEIEFKEGLNILTGETGAGKSILIGALELLLGSRASLDYIRTGAERAQIQALFAINNLKELQNKLEELGFDEGEELLLSREISRSGNNRVRINGQLATVGMVKEISPLLIDIHGQHEHQSLFSTEIQLQLLDNFGGEKLSSKKAELKKIYQKLQETRRELEEIHKSAREREEKLKLLEFQIKELDDADLKQDEEEELQSEHKILSNGELLFTRSRYIFSQLSGEDLESGLLDQLGYLLKELEELKNIDEKLKSEFDLMSNSYYQLQELSHQVRDYADQVVFDEERLREVENRLGEINDLKRKYGPKFADVLDFHKRIKEEYKTLQKTEEESGELKEEKRKLENEYTELAAELSKIRHMAAEEMEKRLVEELQGLAMPETRFKVDFKTIKDPKGLEWDGEKIKFYEHGVDQVEFLLSPNPGEELKPLSKIASGGEISRLMLALKALTADQEQVPTMIFDEIDSGIGGKTAQKVAEKLARIGDKRQVITITHLPHIASMADEHFYIDKEMDENTTRTRVLVLDEKDRVREIARMLEGDVSSTAISHAEEMLYRAREKK